MNSKKVLDWIINSIKERGSVDVIRVQDLMMQSQEVPGVSDFISLGSDGNSQTKKFENSIALSRLVVKTVEWLNGIEGKQWMRTNGKIWSTEEIGKNIFGWQKSFMYKMLRLGRLPDSVVLEYNQICKARTDAPTKYGRTIEDLLKFARERYS
jgi:hypothetical protein